ncbi:tetratricopeptide repeat protein [Povalibacter uvarum]|uniref:tetratricopeptide repeat protein n=1 Tax=Povalibacter uvarum TaxID=732238 RepID=UPI001C866904|nr:tetratricopeptide repeat protein [Povalibacter uvarum]
MIAVSVAASALAAEPANRVPEATVAAQSPNADIETALARVTAARSGAEGVSLEAALTALGDAHANAGQYEAAAPAYNEALQLAERHGFEDVRVLTPLTGLGIAFSRSGHHDEAVPRLQRALTIQRAKYGLFDVRQQETLKVLAASLTALDRKQEAQDFLVYRGRVAEKAYGAGDVKVVEAMCDLGNWFAETGKTEEARMSFKVALDNASWKLSPNHPAVVEPLRGIARAQMLRQSYPEEWLRPRSPKGCKTIALECSPPFRMDSRGHRIILPRKLDPEGEDALKRALWVLEADPRASSEVRVETLIQMGDWQQIKKAPVDALSYYQQAWQLSRAASNASSPAAAAFDSPVRVFYPTPMIVAHIPGLPPEETRTQHVQIEFTVKADGSVADARIVEHDTREQYARDILDAVRVSRFRPKLVDGKPVDVPGIVFRETLWRPEARK